MLLKSSQIDADGFLDPFYSLIVVLSIVFADPVRLIIDTDLGFDVDDVGAVSVGNHLADIGKCQLLGVVHNTGFYYGIGGVDVITHYYNRDYNKVHSNSSILLGAYTGPWGSSPQSQNNQNKYTTTIEHDYPSPVQNYNQTLSAVDAYTQMLINAPDGSVVIASIGELTNLRDIIKANKDLFVKKVKMIYYMDGSYNFGCGDSNGSGWSPYMGSTDDCYGAAQYVIQNVPSSIKQVFSLDGGGDIYTGGRFNGNNGCGQGPVKEAYQIWTNDGSRSSWDPITVYLAVMGDTALYSSLQAGTNTVDYYGNEHFNTGDTNNNQYHVWIDSSHNGDVTRILDNALCAAPCLAPKDIPFGGCSEYQLNSMKNCYNGHGAVDLENPVGSSAGTMSLYDCQQLCGKTAECDGVTVSNNGTINKGFVNCYRRGNINLEQCAGGYNYDTWTMKS